MHTINTKKPVWKVYGHLPPFTISKVTGEEIGRIISFVNATDEQTAFDAAKKEWPEGTTFQKAHEIDTNTGYKKKVDDGS